MRLEKLVSKMGLRSLGCWTDDPVIKKHRNFEEIFDVRGCDFSIFSQIAISGDLTSVPYTVFLFFLHFSICACHPCAGAMLIFSVSFQF